MVPVPNTPSAQEAPLGSQAHPERPKVPDITTLSLVVDYLAACWIQPLPQPAVNSAWEILPSLSVSTI
jgi:hypothetical protein